MSRDVLVAGVGNIFQGDDAFGVEVAHRLERAPLPPGTAVVDFGVRGLHLAFELLTPLELLVVVDTVSRGKAPGTLYLIDPELEPEVFDEEGPDAHGMSLPVVFSTLVKMGGRVPPTRIVGCEPARLDEGMRLSEPVQRAVDPAARMVRRVLEQRRSYEKA